MGDHDARYAVQDLHEAIPLHGSAPRIHGGVAVAGDWIARAAPDARWSQHHPQEIQRARDLLLACQRFADRDSLSSPYNLAMASPRDLLQGRQYRQVILRVSGQGWRLAVAQEAFDTLVQPDDHLRGCFIDQEEIPSVVVVRSGLVLAVIRDIARRRDPASLREMRDYLPHIRR